MIIVLAVVIAANFARVVIAALHLLKRPFQRQAARPHFRKHAMNNLVGMFFLQRRLWQLHSRQPHLLSDKNEVEEEKEDKEVEPGEDVDEEAVLVLNIPLAVSGM